jgi:hypothetical protein
MQLIPEEIEGSVYLDLVLSPSEIKRIEKSEMISGEIIIKRRKYYLGVRLRGMWEYDQNQDAE